MTTDTERAEFVEALRDTSERAEICIGNAGLISEKTHEALHAQCVELMTKVATYIESHPPVDAGWGKSEKGDMRKIDGAWWVCTDPDMDRWITHGEMTEPADAAVERDAGRYRWLCDNACDLNFYASGHPMTGAVEIDPEQYPVTSCGSAKEQLDELIDSALTAQHKEG